MWTNKFLLIFFLSLKLSYCKMIDEIFHLRFPVFLSWFPGPENNNDNREKKVTTNFLFFSQHHQSLKILGGKQISCVNKEKKINGKWFEGNWFCGHRKKRKERKMIYGLWGRFNKIFENRWMCRFSYLFEPRFEQLIDIWWSFEMTFRSFLQLLSRENAA